MADARSWLLPLWTFSDLLSYLLSALGPHVLGESLTTWGPGAESQEETMGGKVSVLSVQDPLSAPTSPAPAPCCLVHHTSFTQKSQLCSSSLRPQRKDPSLGILNLLFHSAFQLRSPLNQCVPMQAPHSAQSFTQGLNDKRFASYTLMRNCSLSI